MSTTTTNYSLIKPAVNDPTDEDLWGGYLNTDLDTLDSTIFALLPSGLIAPYAGTSAPTGWLLCYGQAVSRSTYAALFAAIGTTYGAGDGSTTFGLPDLRGRSVFGKDDMGGSAASRITNANSGVTGTSLGASGGSELLQQHTHTASVTDPGHAHAGGQAAFQNSASSGGGQTWYGSASSTSSSTTGISVSIANSGTGSSQNVPPAFILNYIIKQ